MKIKIWYKDLVVFSCYLKRYFAMKRHTHDALNPLQQTQRPCHNAIKGRKQPQIKLQRNK